MKKYLKGIVFGVLATLSLAFLLKSVTGQEWIGYSPESRFFVGVIFGVLVGGLAGLPQLVKPKLFSSPFATVFSAAVVALGLWIAECLLLAGTNAGFSPFGCLLAFAIGSWIGLGMHVGNTCTSWKSTG